jgi:hypothetical protein
VVADDSHLVSATVSRTWSSLLAVLLIAAVAVGCSGGSDEDGASDATDTTESVREDDGVEGSDDTAASGDVAGSANDADPEMCSYEDAGNGAAIEAEVGGVLVDSRGSAYAVAEDCSLTFLECRYTTATGEVVAGAPLTTVTVTDGTSIAFGEDCSVATDPAAGAVSPKLIEACASIEGRLVDAISDGQWSCTEVPLGDTTDSYPQITELLEPFCASSSDFTSGVLSTEAPWIAGWSCSDPSAAPAGPADDIAAACASVAGTLTEGPGADDWSCRDVPLGATTDAYASVETLLAPFCAAPGELTSGLLSAAAPWLAGWSCRAPS